MGARLPSPNRGRPAPVSASIALAPMDPRLLGRSVFHDKNLGLRLPLVDLAVALTPGYSHVAASRLGWEVNRRGGQIKGVRPLCLVRPLVNRTLGRPLGRRLASRPAKPMGASLIHLPTAASYQRLRLFCKPVVWSNMRPVKPNRCSSTVVLIAPSPACPL
jgi:hypothetical protein